MKQLGRQVTLMHELRVLEKQGNKKLGNIAKRDNDAAIKHLRRKIKEEKLRHEYNTYLII